MVALPLGVQAYQRMAGFQPEVRLVNLYMEKDESGVSPDNLMRVQRPGLALVQSLDSRVRGLYQQDGVFGGDMFASTTTQLYRAGSPVAAMAGSGLVAYAASVGLLAMAVSGTLYGYDGTSVAPIAIPQGTAADIDQLNAYVIVGTPSGRFYWIVPGETTIDPLNFATAESAQDGLVAVRRLGDEIWLFGTRTIEPWQATGDPDAPFARAAGRQLDRGCLSRDAVQRFDNTLVWVGENCVVYKAGAVPQRISTHAIEERIRNRSALPSAWVYGMEDGHRFYILRIPGQGTFAFDAATSGWSHWTSEDLPEWRADVGVDTPSGTFASDAMGNGLLQLVPGLSTDLGVNMTRLVSGTVPVSGKPPPVDSLSVAVGAAADCTLQIRWRGAQEAFPDYWDEAEVRAPADLVNIYRLGAAEPPYRTFEMRVTDPVAIRISGALVNEGWA